MQAQLLRNRHGRVRKVQITLRGQDIAHPATTDAMKSAVLKGVLGALVDQPVTYVNAISTADLMGLSTSVDFSQEQEGESGYANSLEVKVVSESGPQHGFTTTRTIQGTVFGRDELRVTKIDGVTLDLPPGEYTYVRAES